MTNDININNTEEKPSFEVYFEKRIKNRLTNLEKDRKLYLTLSIVIPAILICLLLFLETIRLQSNHNNSPNVQFYAMSIAGIGFLYYSIQKVYKNKVKVRVLPVILSYLGNFKLAKKTPNSDTHIIEDILGPISLVQTPLSSFSDYLHKLNLFEKFDMVTCDDHIIGTYKGVNLDIYDFELKKLQTNSYTIQNGHRTKISGSNTISIFKGAFLKFKCPKQLKYKTVVKKNMIHTIPESLQKVNLEDPEFEKYYKVYSGDQIESRSLLTPAFMNRMVTLATQGTHIGKDITISFEQGNVNIAIESQKDWFEVSIFKPVDDISNYKEIINELKIIFSIIDTLKYSKQE